RPCLHSRRSGAHHVHRNPTGQSPSLIGRHGRCHRSHQEEQHPGQVLTASMVRTPIEFFDFYAYATASSLVFPALFFPNQTSTTQLLSSFAIFGVAFVARPLGSIIFGHFGDRIGRKKTLIASLLIMGIGTFLIGLLPTAS